MVTNRRSSTEWAVSSMVSAKGSPKTPEASSNETSCLAWLLRSLSGVPLEQHPSLRVYACSSGLWLPSIQPNGGRQEARFPGVHVTLGRPAVGLRQRGDVALDRLPRGSPGADFG